MSTKLPTQTLKPEETKTVANEKDKFTDKTLSTPATSDTSSVEPLPKTTIPPPPEKSTLSKYWKFGLAIISMLILLILLVFAVYFIKKPETPSGLNTPTQTNVGPMPAPTPAAMPAPVLTPIPTPMPAPAATAPTENKGFFDRLFNKGPQTSKPTPTPIPSEPIAGVVPSTAQPKVGGSKSRGKSSSKKNSKDMSSSISKTLKEMKKIKMKGGCDCNLPLQ